MTAQGTILGTFQYMAPEQLEGQDADSRSDIVAFGCVLFEMVTGRKAFQGKTQVGLIGAILKDDSPAVSTLQAMSPPTLDFVVRKCLAKDDVGPDGRFLFVKAGTVNQQQQITVVENWIEELKARVPSK